MLPTLARKFENLKIEEKSRGEIANLGMKIQRSEKKEKNCYFLTFYPEFLTTSSCFLNPTEKIFIPTFIS